MADNVDQITKLCQATIQDIIQSMGGVTDLLNNDSKTSTVNAIMKRLDRLGVDLNDVLGDQLAKQYYQGVHDADSFLYQLGKDVSVEGINKSMHLSALDQIVSDTMNDMNASIRTAQHMSIQNIDDILAGVRDEIGKGIIQGNSSKIAGQRVAREFAKNGMTSFITKDGKRLPLDFYAPMVARTKYKVANTTGAVTRYQETGVHHVKINEHHPTCGQCAKYQGKVVALNEDNADGFPVADVGIPLPPYHPNCQHSARPYPMDYHSQSDIDNEKRKWNSFDQDDDPRTRAQKSLYKTEQAIRRKTNQEKKDYRLLKATDPDNAPKSLGAYRRMKRKDDDEWKALQSSYAKKQDEIDAIGPGKGTPQKRKGTASGVKGSGKKKPPSSGQNKKQASGQNNDQDKTETSSVMSTLSALNITPDKADQIAFDEFDQVIDGIEYTDRRKSSKHILSSIPGANFNVRVAKIGANGHNSKITAPGGKVNIGEFALLNKDMRPEQYQWKTMYHEFFHAKLQGLDYNRSSMFNQAWTRWEETATESSAFFMMHRAGFDVSTIMPSYSEYLTNTLPVLKQLDEFKDCETMVDFGAKFMKYRFDPDHANGEWTWLVDKIKTENLNTTFDRNKYFADNYLDHLKGDLDKYTDMVFDLLQQPNKNSMETSIKSSIKNGLEKGIDTKTVNWEVEKAMPVIMNELGVKRP